MYPVEPSEKIVPITISIDEVSHALGFDFTTVAESALRRCLVTHTRAFECVQSKKLDPPSERRTARLHERKKFEV